MTRRAWTILAGTACAGLAAGMPLRAQDDGHDALRTGKYQQAIALLQNDEPSPVQAVAQSEVASEPAVTQEVARGGVTRDESGQIKKTYEGTEAPKACPT